MFPSDILEDGLLVWYTIILIYGIQIYCGIFQTKCRESFVFQKKAVGII